MKLKPRNFVQMHVQGMCVTKNCICTACVTALVICGHVSHSGIFVIVEWCLEVQNYIWANFVNEKPKIKNYTNANRILWQNKNAAWVLEWFCCFKNRQKPTEKSNNPVSFEMTWTHLQSGNLWSMSNHSDWRFQIKYKFVPRLSTQKQKENCSSVASHFLA